jgi:5'-nucleotidase|tara:strand:+ start:3230 stop:3961 length:732 start_codon:yes stop_codon:yes gene_type:complete
MKILLTNDDGYKAPGIKILEKLLLKYGDVTVAGPFKNMSACSSSLSVHDKVSYKKIDSKHYIVKGTPADCIHIIGRGEMQIMPDIVFSGINFGSNMGDDVIYSGTVAGAIEGRFCKYSPIAISISSREPKYLNDIDDKVNFILTHIFQKKLKSKNIYNINIPDIPFSKIRGIKYTMLGNREISMKPNLFKSNNNLFAQIGAVGKPLKSTKKTDFNALKSNYISITPLTINMCDAKKIKNIILK